MKKVICLFVVCLIAFTACKKDKDVPETPKDPSVDFIAYTNEGTISSGGGQVILEDTSPLKETSINIPSGALTINAKIKVQVDNSIRPTGDETSNVLKLEPEGLTFSKPVTIKIPVSKTLSNPILYYFIPDSMVLQQVPILEYNQTEGYIRAEINHFSKYLVKENAYVSFDAWLYNSGTSIKAKVKFGGNNGLASVPVTKLNYLISLGTCSSARQFIDYAIPVTNLGTVKVPEQCYGTLNVDLRQGNWLYSTSIKSIKLAVQRKGLEPSNSSWVIVSMVNPQNKALFTSGILDPDKREDFFSGKALVFNFDTPAEIGKNYYLQLSWCLSSTPAGYWLAGRFTDVYEVNTYQGYPAWTTSNMINSDPDKNKNFVDDLLDVVPNNAPLEPSNPSPANNATGISTSTSLSWDCTDPEGDPLTYDIYFGTINPPTAKISSDQTSKSYTTTGLIAGKDYYWKIVAKDSKGNNTEGPIWKLTTQTLLGTAPVADFSVSSTSITKGQSIQFTDKSVNSPTSWLWDFGDNTTSTAQNPTKTYNTAGSYTVSLKATNSYGNSTKTQDITVTEPDGSGGTGTLVYQGRIYKTAIFGGKEWMTENLAYLPSVFPPSSGSYTEARYYVYGYNGSDVATAKQQANYTTYGVLYNWPAAKAVCPPGWHLPTEDEWKQLIDYLGGWSVASGKMKEIGTVHWLYPNTEASNESGFSALPAGCRIDVGKFSSVGEYAFWWSFTEDSTNRAWKWFLSYGSSDVGRYNDYKDQGFSVRYVKD